MMLKTLTGLLGRGGAHTLLASALLLARHGHEREGGALDQLLQDDEKL